MPYGRGRPWAFKGGNYRALLENPYEEGTAKLLLDNLYKRFGLPDSIISDRDPRFAAKSFQELLRLLGVKSKLTTAYHPKEMVQDYRTIEFTP